MRAQSLLLFLVVFSFLAGCTTQRPRPHRVEPPPYVTESKPGYSTPAPTEPAPPIPTDTEFPATTETPVPGGRPDRPKVVLVTGGAGMASFALIGLLKRLHEEGLVVDTIVASGWPSLIALSYGFSRSIHDVEWFASRLTEKDLKALSSMPWLSDAEKFSRMPSVVEKAFGNRDLGETRLPIVLSTQNTQPRGAIEDRGDWRTLILQTMSFPGLYNPFPSEGDIKEIGSLKALEVEEALRRNGAIVVAVTFYDDYLQALKDEKGKTGGAPLRRAYASQLRRSLADQIKDAHVAVQISTHRGPTEFAGKRLAIVAGYKDGIRVARLLRKKIGELPR